MLSNHPHTSRPASPMREYKELPRSEQLLRDALRRDDARTPPRTPTAHKYSSRTVRERGLSESSEKRRRMGGYGGDSEFSAAVTWERERSSSPTPQPRRRYSVSRSGRASSPFSADFAQPTAHEVVLRNRLEGVLMTARSIQGCLERSSSPDILASCSSSECSDVIRMGSHSFQIPPTPSSSSSGYLPVSTAPPDVRAYDQEQDYYDNSIEAQMLTPPPTPPYLPATIPHSPHQMIQTSVKRKLSKRQRSDPLPSAPSPSSPPLPRSPSSPQFREYGNLSAASPASPKPQFNARTASAQCRDMPGYISFAAIEGLGAPANLDCDDDDRAGSRAAKDHSGGSLWGFLGRKKN